MEDFTNLTFDEIEVGRKASVTRVLSLTEVESLVMVAGDIDPFHLEPLAGRGAPEMVADAIGAEAIISALINRRLPGPGTVILAQELQFDGEIRVGDELTAEIEVSSRDASTRQLVIDCRVCRGDERLLHGTVRVRAPSERIHYSNLAPPHLSVRHNDAFAKLLRRCEESPPVRCAVVHPCDRASLEGPLEAARRGLIVPVLVGPEARIRRVAEENDFDLAAIRIVSVEHSHAAAEAAVKLARDGEVAALMKGSLHTDELLSAMVPSSAGMRTDRRMSHVFVMDVPAYPRLLLVTDAAVNIAPDLAQKADITQNAIDLARVLGIDEPRVAILSAVENVNPHLQSTIDAAALCKMADRGQITGGRLDGPLAFDNAVSEEAARTKGIDSEVAGRADILVVPDVESGNMIAKQLQYLAGADSAGIVLGARVPVVLTSRADQMRARIASIAVMVLLAQSQSGKSDG
jgi:phosphate acetyltransferase